ncbi:MAG: putative membrane protein SirB2 [Candidatus Pseudothioglobus sp.]|jgi:uncharacterized membrane protein SirB2
MLAGSALSGHVALKWLSYLVDTTLLTAGLLLMHITQQHPGSHDWLSVKLVLLVVYIGLGIFALRRGRTRGQRAAYFIAALATYLFIISIALTHNPLGVFAR